MNLQHNLSNVFFQANSMCNFYSILENLNLRIEMFYCMKKHGLASKPDHGAGNDDKIEV